MKKTVKTSYYLLVYRKPFLISIWYPQELRVVPQDSLTGSVLPFKPISRSANKRWRKEIPSTSYFFIVHPTENQISKVPVCPHESEWDLRMRQTRFFFASSRETIKEKNDRRSRCHTACIFSLATLSRVQLLSKRPQELRVDPQDAINDSSTSSPFFSRSPSPWKLFRK